MAAPIADGIRLCVDLQRAALVGQRGFDGAFASVRRSRRISPAASRRLSSGDRTEVVDLLLVHVRDVRHRDGPPDLRRAVAL
jgi:hypothetical protein